VRWQGATTPLAFASKEEQRRQRASGQPDRVCSVLTKEVFDVDTNIV
jgi:hypothetical protein